MRSLTIAGGKNRWGDLRHDTLTIDRALTYQMDTCSFEITGKQPYEGQEVIVEAGETRLFAGIIVQVDMVDKDLDLWAVECDDYTAVLDQKLVVETYKNMAADDIFRDIVAKYCPGFTADGVRPGAPMIESTGSDFEYKRPSECFKWLCDYVGWHWQVDYYKNISFFSADELASPAPMALEPGGAFVFGGHSINTQGLRNRVYVRGGTMLSDPQKIEWKADGVARIWSLPWAPNEASISVGEEEKIIGIENVDKDQLVDYLVDLDDKYIRCSKRIETPIEGVTISLTARQDIDVISMAEDIESQEAIARVQGGDGVYEHVINDESLVTIEAAEAAGYADLREHANPKVTGSFTTEVEGWYPGQLVTVNLPDRGVEGTFLVQRVTLRPAWPDPPAWEYDVEYGGRLKGIADVLQALVSKQQKQKMNETAILHKFVYGADRVEMQDEIEGSFSEIPFEVEDSKEIIIEPETGFEYTETTQADFQSGTLTDVVATSAGDLELTAENKFLTNNPRSGYVAHSTGGSYQCIQGKLAVGETTPVAFTSGKLTGGSWGEIYDIGKNVNIESSNTDYVIWVFDLKDNYSITEVFFEFIIVPAYSSSYGCQEAIAEYSIDNVNYTAIGQKDLSGITAGGNHLQSWTGINKQARYVKIKIKNKANKYLAVNEIGIVGKVYKSSGTRETIVDLSGANPAGVTKIEWQATTPAGTSVKIETALSMDGGNTYDEYQEVNNGGDIPGITPGTDLSNARLKIRQILNTSDGGITPQLHNLYLTIQGEPEAWQTVGGMISIAYPDHWPYPLYQVSTDSANWGEWQEISPDGGAVEVPYPGYIRIVTDEKIKVYNWKKPLIETDTVCGFVVVG